MIEVFSCLAGLSLVLTLWQFVAACRFPLHRRNAQNGERPAVTVLKPLKGCDQETVACLRSWLVQNYPGPVQFLFGVASPDDPVCEPVRTLVRDFPDKDAILVVCRESLGPNPKVSTLIPLQRLAKHEIIVVSDADVRVAEDFLLNAVEPLRDETVGLVNCFYRLAQPQNLPMRLEAIGTNSDFWSQVLQARSLSQIDFALGAVMITRRGHLERIGGFEALVDYLADDYMLGNLIARNQGRIVFSPLVVDCCSGRMSWPEVWSRQRRWARTMRFCKPLPYFFSILSNATLWPFLWWVSEPGVWPGVAACLFTRVLTSLIQQWRFTRDRSCVAYAWLVPVKDLLQAALWALAFVGHEVTWKNRRFRVRRGGRLVGEVHPPRFY